MPINYKLAFFDLDGTIVNSRFEITARTRAALKGLEGAGVRCAIATGRPLFSTKPIIEDLGIAGASMVFSGAMIYDPSVKKPIYQTLMPNAALEQLVLFCREHNVLCELYADQDYWIELKSPLTDIHMEYLKHPPLFEDLTRIAASREVIKACLMMQRGSREERLIREFSACHKELETGFTTGTAHPDIAFANITDKSATRESAFQFLLKHYAVSASEVMAFGDGEQDGFFVSSAGFGVAMENGSDQLKRVAKKIAPDADKDGVAQVIEALLR